MRIGIRNDWHLLITLLVSSLCLAPQNTFSQTPVQPLPNAHAHNDYEHERPLLDALAHGFCSVEADIFLIDGELLVGHDKWALKKGRTLKKLYLSPLQAAIRQNQGSVYKDGPLFTLLIDFKADGSKIYPVLAKQLHEFREMLSGIHDGKYQLKAIQIVISGDCPRQLIEDDKSRLVSIDGRLKDLNSKSPSDLMPLISDRWGSHFKWRGQSPINNKVQEKLNRIVKTAHDSGRRVRFWATPESTVVWDALMQAGVDHINTDRLPLLQDYLLKKTANEK